MVWETEYVAFVEANWARYLRLARLLTGDRDRGEELLQDSLVRLYVRWRRAATRDPHAYLPDAGQRQHQLVAATPQGVFERGATGPAGS
jgi:predicted RNA polymerase sigma factor